MADRRIEDTPPVDYIDCEVPRDMTLREWRGGARPRTRNSRLRAAAGAVARAARLRRRS